MTDALPWKALSATVHAGCACEGWILHEAGWPDEEGRCHHVEVAFAVPFESPPVVQIGLTGFDLDQRDSARISIRAEGVTSYGFRAVVVTWAGTRVYGVEFQWLAIGP